MATKGKEIRVVVSIRDGMVSAVYSSQPDAVEVVIVNHDGIDIARGEGEASGPRRENALLVEKIEDYADSTAKEMALYEAGEDAYENDTRI